MSVKQTTMTTLNSLPSPIATPTQPGTSCSYRRSPIKHHRASGRPDRVPNRHTMLTLRMAIIAPRTTAGASSSIVCDAVRTVLATDGRGQPRAVAVGFEPTNGLPRYTLSSSANPSSETVVGVRHVLNQAVRGGHRTRADDDE
jgi:hypothetical protein